MEWLARQPGHSDTSMIKKHYARWIPSDTKSMTGMVSGMRGFSEDIKT
jgi:integrase